MTAPCRTRTDPTPSNTVPVEKPPAASARQGDASAPLSLRVHTSRVLQVPAAAVAEAQAFAAEHAAALASLDHIDIAALAWPRTRMFGALLRNRLRRTDGCRKLILPAAHGLDARVRRLLFTAIGAALGELRRPRCTLLPCLDGSAADARARLHTDHGDGVAPDFLGFLGKDDERVEVVLSDATPVRRRLAALAPVAFRILQGRPRDAAAPADRAVFVPDDEPAGWTLRLPDRSVAGADGSLPPEAAAAMALLAELLADPEHTRRVVLGPGEMLWINNRTVAHAVRRASDSPPVASVTCLRVGAQRLHAADG